VSKSQLSTEANTKIGTSNESGNKKRGLVHSTQSRHSKADRWEYDPDWTPKQQAELDKRVIDND
jgi:hypothetical protein